MKKGHESEGEKEEVSERVWGKERGGRNIIILKPQK